MMNNSQERLARKLNTADAVIIGLGAMIGSGIFVAISPAIAAAGSGVLVGLVLAAFMAYCNATSSAQLAALYPESGGSYVYARKQLGNIWGWLAGWCFVVGKIASCAAAALAFGHYVYAPGAKYLALLALVALTAVNYRGIEKTLVVTRLIVTIVLGALAVTVLACLAGGNANSEHVSASFGIGGLNGILRSGGILFFAFAGYARIATLGEEVLEPRRTIPQAIIKALAITVGVYSIVIISVLMAAGARAVSFSNTPLVTAVEPGRLAFFVPIIRLGAVVATLGVLLSLMLAISRTLFSMAANKELPKWLADVHPKFKVPHHAEIAVALIIGAIILIGDIRGAIGFSAFTILIYYTITNGAAWTLPKEKRLWPRTLSALGLAGCLLLAFSLPGASITIGAIVLTAGLAIYTVRSKLCKTG